MTWWETVAVAISAVLIVMNSVELTKAPCAKTYVFRALAIVAYVVAIAAFVKGAPGIAFPALGVAGFFEWLDRFVVAC